MILDLHQLVEEACDAAIAAGKPELVKQLMDELGEIIRNQEGGGE